jgi:uncharacterized OB-fold protein
MAERSDVPLRVLPRLTPANRPFWTGGAEGELRFQRCTDCGCYVHPPSPRCPRCLGKALRPEAVSGRGHVLTFTWNHKEWIPGQAVPYAIAIVELVEQQGLRLMTEIVRCTPEQLRIGLPVRVVFEAQGEVHVPLFEPADA